MTNKLLWTGERFLPDVEGDVQIEHMHRYYMALKLVKDKAVLDIACGEGYGSNLLSSDAARVVGVDISLDAVLHAQQKYNRKNLSFVRGDCTRIPLENACVDVVVSFETIEHHDKHEAFIGEIKRVLKPDGLLIISSPDKKEYSDLTGHNNEFHVKELYLSEFQKLIKTHFARHTILGQRIKYGSVITPLADTDRKGFISHQKDNKGYVHEEQHIFNPLYFIAVASDAQVPPAYYGLYEHPVEDCEPVNHLLGLLDLKSNELNALTQTFKTLTDQHTALTSDYHRLNDDHLRLQAKADGLNIELENRIAMIQAMQHSTSWVLTRPVRCGKRKLDHWLDIGGKTWGALKRHWFGFVWLKQLITYIRRIGGLGKAVPNVIDILRAKDFNRFKAAAARMAERDEPADAAGASLSVSQEGMPLFRHAFSINNQPGDYLPYEEHDPVDTDLRLIAFYLPQYHPIEENDEAWGKGFTEWTNVTKAVPQFSGHYQPKLPGELGFYDLRLYDVHERQIELAKNYGIHGFCYHYYWFDGKKVLDTPLKRVLEHPELDFPFCINWANENWTKRWDGLENEVILRQNHSPEDDLAFIHDIEPVLKDPRYIRVNGRPLVMIYRPSLFPEIKATVTRWRDHCRICGIGEIFLVASHAHEHLDPVSIGFDAATEFAPNTFQVQDISHQVLFYNDEYQGNVYDYCSAVDYSMKMKRPGYLKFRSLCPGWDNEARKPGKGISFHNASPQLYSKWLDFLLNDTQAHLKGDERIVFINAWNEWAEGAFLEPDRRNGYAYLEKTYQGLRRFDRRRTTLLAETQVHEKRSDIAVVLHLYYMELWEELCEHLASFGDMGFDLYININPECTEDDINTILGAFPRARIYSFENRGRDILPFLKLFDLIYPLGYKAVCKIHSKKSLHRSDGDLWRNQLIGGLIGSAGLIRENLKRLENDPRAGIIVPKGNIFDYQEWIGSNNEMVVDFARENNIRMMDNFTFPSGSMFWFKPPVFEQLYQNIDPGLFGVEQGQLDGTMAHSIERLFGLLCHHNGYCLVESSNEQALKN